VFTGFAEGFPQTWEGTDYAESTITLSDGFEPMANALLVSSVAYMTTTFGNDKDITYTAVAFGGAYNYVAISYVQGGINAPLSVFLDELNSVNPFSVIVTLATDSGGAVTSTAADVVHAINDDFLTTGLVTAAIASGQGGTGVLGSMPPTNLDHGTFVPQLSGARINAVLDAIAWPAGQRNIDAGQYIMAGVGFGPKDGQDALSHIQEVSDSELGYFFIDASGTAVFHDSLHRSTANASKVSNSTWSDVESDGLEYLNLIPSYDKNNIVNDAQITPSGSGGSSAAAESQDVPSQAKYFRRTLARSTVLANPRDAQIQANFIVATYKEPQLRFSTMTVKPITDSTLWTQVLGREIGDRIRVHRHPPGGGNVMASDCFIEAISWKLDGTDAEITWELSPASGGTAGSATNFVLNNSTTGRLDSGNSLSI
jgi:hypothetical protein